VARLIKAPFFFVAVGSQANVGGAASAPVVAGAFHPSLAPVGVLMAVLGWKIYWRFAFPFNYLWLIVPTGSYLLWPMQWASTYFSVMWLRWVEVPTFVTWENFYVQVPTGLGANDHPVDAGLRRGFRVGGAGDPVHPQRPPRGGAQLDRHLPAFGKPTAGLGVVELTTALHATLRTPHSFAM